MCECCNVEKYSYHLEGVTELTLDWCHYTGLYIRFNSNNNKFTLAASGEGEAEIEINYCPICGRELTQKSDFKGR